MTAGRIVYLLYHQPRAAVCRSIRQGGPYQQWLDAQGAAAMRQSAWALPPPSHPKGSGPLELHLVTGRAYVEQSLFCVWSFAKAARRPVAPFFHDDGTLSSSLRDRLRRVFPEARFEPAENLSARLEKYLPAARFPVLRERFLHYPHLRKLICPHLGQKGWKLVLDSDLLFFREPALLLKWLDSPETPLCLVDVANAYGYSPKLLEEIAEKIPPERVNVGVCGLRSESLDWERLEAWCAQLLAREGTHYLLEQALTALLLAGASCLFASAREYVVRPEREETLVPRAVMHHYGGETKRAYFRQAWRQVLGLKSL